MSPTVRSAEGAAGVEWRFEPWRERPLRAAAALIAAIALGLLALRTVPYPLAGWALFVGVLALLAPAYLPIACRLDDQGVARRIGWGWERRGWEAVRRARLDEQGVYVTPLRAGGPLEPFRGLMLPLPRRPDPELLAAVRAGLHSHGH
ncbi:MAG TPA: hypothetical protein VMJ70_05095 [Candidatus Sulfotelmatobacter sp.]|nr:hypothetical protein [Candidatus Sulfotelmatobacter sp.]